VLLQPLAVRWREMFPRQHDGPRWLAQAARRSSAASLARPMLEFEERYKSVFYPVLLLVCFEIGELFTGVLNSRAR
jgi:hypothetical protein